MNSEDESKSSNDENVSSTKLPPAFKKPLLIGKVGRLPRKVTKSDNIKENASNSNIKDSTLNIEATSSNTSENENINSISESINTKNGQDEAEKNMSLQYREPSWSGLPSSESQCYEFKVLKSGSVIESLNLMGKSFWVFGRLAACDICLAHPTVSRYHAILQYRSEAYEDQPCGFYLYDLASTHGTFLNKSRLKSRVYARVRVGHMIKFGCSTRAFLLTGPNEDMEEESEFTVSELKQQRIEELLKREEMEKETELRIKQEEEAKQKLFEEKGVDWGMGEDADEETDLSENPFAQTNNEELYIDDPKKALRGYMEREGHDLEYDCTEQGMGQFLCKVELPIDDEKGRPIVAEILHKGKKKEAVIQCALEACRILDRYGLLRQATHESRKRKVKNWEDNDFYDSDDDTFLDRTGIIEKKRENRMKAKTPQQAETYQSLTEKQKKLHEEITAIEKLLSDSNKSTRLTSSTGEEDTLDSYMQELKQSKLDKQKVSKLKTDLYKLKYEYTNIMKLVNIAKPTDLPALVEPKSQEHSGVNVKSKLPLYGKRLKVKVQVPVRSQKENVSTMDDEDEDDENKEKENIEDSTEVPAEQNEDKDDISSNSHAHNVVQAKQNLTFKKPVTDVIKSRVNLEQKYFTNCTRIDSSFKKLFNFMTGKHEAQVLEFWTALKALNENSFSNDKKQDAVNLIMNYIDGVDALIQQTVSKNVDDITTAINNANNNEEIIVIGNKLVNIVKEVTHLVNKLEKVDDMSEKQEEPNTASELERRAKKNQRRLQHRQEKAEIEKRRGYEEDAMKEDYNMWIPPEGQTGDGRTRLNDKLGY